MPGKLACHVRLRLGHRSGAKGVMSFAQRGCACGARQAPVHGRPVHGRPVHGRPVHGRPSSPPRAWVAARPPGACSSLAAGGSVAWSYMLSHSFSTLHTLNPAKHLAHSVPGGLTTGSHVISPPRRKLCFPSRVRQLGTLHLTVY